MESETGRCLPFPRRLFHTKNIGSERGFRRQNCGGFLDDQPFGPCTGGERLVTNTDWKTGEITRYRLFWVKSQYSVLWLPSCSLGQPFIYLGLTLVSKPFHRLLGFTFLVRSSRSAFGLRRPLALPPVLTDRRGQPLGQPFILFMTPDRFTISSRSRWQEENTSHGGHGAVESHYTLTAGFRVYKNAEQI